MKKKRETRKILGIADSYFTKFDESLEIYFSERPFIEDFSLPRVITPSRKRMDVDVELGEIHIELMEAIENYGWRN